MKWFVIAIGLLAIGLALRLELLVFAMYVLLGVLLIGRWTTREWTNRIAVTRTGSATEMEIGESAEIRIEMSNRGRLAVPWAIVEEALPVPAMKPPYRLKVTGKTRFVLRLKAGETRAIRYRVDFLRRGYHQFGPLLIESGDLFGLHRRYRVVSQPVYVLVHPEIVPLKGYDIASRRPLGEIRMTHRLFEDPTRIAGVRPYQPGDPMNRIHWPAFARTGSLHSKIFEPSCVAGLTLLLDFHRDSFEGSDLGWIEDLAITTGASLAHAVFEMGQQVGLVTNGRDAAERVRSEGWQAAWSTRREAMRQWKSRAANRRIEPIVLPPRKSPEQVRRIRETLARLEQTDGFRFEELIRETASRIPRDTSVVAVMVQVTEEAARALGELRRSGYSVTVIVITPRTTEFREWAEPTGWAGMLIGENIEFRVVDSAEALSELEAATL